jgi:pimeloyl-ACP methyl ester carboxylesterase
MDTKNGILLWFFVVFTMKAIEADNKKCGPSAYQGVRRPANRSDRGDIYLNWRFSRWRALHSPSRINMEIESRTENVEGERMHYLLAGPESGQPLLLIHGLFGGSFCWRLNISTLAQRYRVFALDLPGLGLSDVGRGVSCGMQAQAMRLLAFLAANGLSDVKVVGSSWGGAVSMMLAGMTDRVSCLALAAPVNPWSRQGEERIRFFRGFTGGLLLRCGLRFSGRFHAPALAAMYGDPSKIPPGTMEGYSALVYRPGRARALHNILRNWDKDVRSLNDVVSGIKQPVLLIWGDRDRAVEQSSASRLVDTLPHAELEVIAGAGHLPSEEVPEVFNRLVLDFFERVSKAVPH